MNGKSNRVVICKYKRTNAVALSVVNKPVCAVHKVCQAPLDRAHVDHIPEFSLFKLATETAHMFFVLTCSETPKTDFHDKQRLTVITENRTTALKVLQVPYDK